MASICEVCGKGTMSGNNVSHSNRKTRRTFKVNVQKVEVNGSTGYVCTRCIKTLKKAEQN